MTGAVETQLPEDLKSKLVVKWFDPERLWYAVPQKPMKLRHATAEDMKEVMEIFRGLVKDAQHSDSTASH